MNTKIIDRSADLSASLREYMESKVIKLEKFFSRISDAQILIAFHKKNMYSVEITANANGVMLRGEDRSQDLRKSFDLALKNLEKQIKRRSSYLKDKAHYNNNETFTFNLEGDYDSDDSQFDDLGIVRIKKIPVRPMLAEEAIMQMDLLGHEFFMFLEAQSGKMNVIYRRKDGGYGQIQPID